MTKCYKCETDLTNVNKTDEHIILNACGGRLKSKELLCRICNSQFGKTFDAELTKQVNDLANLLMIKRHRGRPQSFKGKIQSTGEEYYLQYGGKPRLIKPTISQKSDGKETQISITARDEKEAKQILQGLKRKHPGINVEKTLESAKFRSEYLDKPLHFSFTIGGKEVFKSIAKSAINYFIYKGGNRKYITHLLPYLDGNRNLEIVWMHYPDKTIYSPLDNEVSHIIRLIGNPTENILYTYIELFNTHNFIIKLSDNFDGEAINETYAFDIIETKKLVRSIPLNYTRKQLLDMQTDNTRKQFAEIKRRLIRVLSIVEKRQISNHNRELIGKAYDNSFDKYPDETIITQEMVDKFVAEATKNFTPFIIHQFKRRKNENDTEIDE